ncbi:unnamed protein product (macronuclear) [Paramecium tetraurelia]|uniref:t-SNARE coiled-coil homology domain-containing protein n=1 Tax=Paramecium tetraurelia TaxID=5888 RepID=A0CCX2_PARTE|nr:uncharacterized protein GSPATT00037424001 [Paramecium tetraurelia]CAK68639.1 unnamed protein product [Paramecium tetraurelia]|eukprot:XP_001436036.1 hypothetical protein (macronuclear) [Paramecium tetraurelia strain d4-2]
MRSQRVVVLLERLYRLDEKLGGNERKKNVRNPQKEFDQMIEDLKEEVEMISAKQKDRDQRNQKYGNDEDAIRFGVEIRESILKCESQYKSLEKTLLRQLKKPKKYNQNDLELRVTSFKLLKIALKGTKMREFGVEEQEFKGVTLNELKNQVFEGGTQFQKNQLEYQEQLSLEDQEAIQRWNLNDEYMDKQLDQIIAGLDQMHYKVQAMSQKIDETGGRVKELIQEVDKTNQSLTSANKALKRLTEVYRRPNKFALDIAFILLLLGLIATVVTTVTKKR